MSVSDISASGAGEYMTVREAAAYLRISMAMLKRLNLGIQVSPRKTVYRRADLDAWMEAKRRDNGKV